MWSETLCVVTDLVTRTAAAARDVTDRVDAVVDIVGARLGATVGLQVRADLEHVDVTLVGSALTPTLVAGLRHQLRAGQLRDPMFDRVRAGDLAPSTAERAYGPAEWAASAIRRQVRLLWDVDQIAMLPVAAGDHFVVFLFGRPGKDFEESDLGMLEQVQPVVIGLGMLTDGDARPLPPDPSGRPTLTPRESQVMVLLASGHKAATIARMVGCSHRTVHRHLGNIYAKLGVGDRLSAVQRASALGMIEV